MTNMTLARVGTVRIAPKMSTPKITTTPKTYKAIPSPPVAASPPINNYYHQNTGIANNWFMQYWLWQNINKSSDNKIVNNEVKEIIEPSDTTSSNTLAMGVYITIALVFGVLCAYIIKKKRGRKK